MNNLFVAYDLIPPGQNYEAVRAKIKSLGRWFQPQYSLFYLHTALSSQQVSAEVSAVMDAKDRLVVIDANAAVFSPANDAEIAAINRTWFSQAA